MLRVLVILVALVGVARADDFVPQARKMTDAALGRYNSEIDSRNFLLRLNDMLDDSLITNVKHAHEHLLEAKSEFDKDPALQTLDDVKVAADRLQNSITAYRAEAKTTMLKIGGGLALAILVVFGGAIYALILRSRRR